MANIKLTELQVFRMHESRRHAGEVLRNIKQKPLTGKNKETMQMLENAVATLDLVVMRCDK